ncbi:MAG: 3-demethylubiquinone-9 3-methyltransferase [Proteobacteria bacterium]|nr:3-demethylubiquinone-9 3-methyltransferase [Pseudomonadota bacterium]
MHIEPYLHFAGRCEEALNFYSQAIGARIDMLMRYRDSPEPPPPGTLAPGMENKVMHANLRLGDSCLMASDDCTRTDVRFQGFQLTLNVADEAEAKCCFSALAEGGEIRMPLAKTFFSPCFGMLTDRFGVSWMVIVFEP